MWGFYSLLTIIGLLAVFFFFSFWLLSLPCCSVLSGVGYLFSLSLPAPCLLSYFINLLPTPSHFVWGWQNCSYIGMIVISCINKNSSPTGCSPATLWGRARTPIFRRGIWEYYNDSIVKIGNDISSSWVVDEGCSHPLGPYRTPLTTNTFFDIEKILQLELETAIVLLQKGRLYSHLKPFNSFGGVSLSNQEARSSKSGLGHR